MGSAWPGRMRWAFKCAAEIQDEDLVRLYLDSIGKYPLLTKEEEMRLSQVIQEGREAKEEWPRAA